jgi:hypothetical protein
MGELLMFPGVEKPEVSVTETEPEVQDWDEWRDEQVAQFNSDATYLEGADQTTFFEAAVLLAARIQSWMQPQDGG